MKKLMVFLLFGTLSINNSYTQEYNTDWECGCQPDTVLPKELGNSIKNLCADLQGLVKKERLFADIRFDIWTSG